MKPDFVPQGSVEIPPIPVQDELLLDPGKTAIVVVDMQNDFVKPGGTLAVENAAATVEHIAALLARARAAGVKIAYTQDTHYPGDREWEIWPAHCAAESWGWQIIDELAPAEGDLVCRKSRYDGFYDTWLDHYLTRIWQVENLIIVGTVASICVLHTAASAGLRWFHVVVPANGVSALTPFDQALTLRQVSWLYSGSVVRREDDIRFT
ncbi:MAG: cysteine hydrolase [Caldilineaceae bacterium]|nr:cysteine hydrolase [Caldilineaceae bacterium]